MNVTSLLEKQHRTVKAIFKRLESGRSAAAPLLRELADSLAAHMAIEQDIFYPAVRSLKEDLVSESFEEHAVAELALKRLLATAPEDRSFKAKVTTLRELIEHHVEEEESDLFPLVNKKIDAKELESLGSRMKTAFDVAFGRGIDALVPKSMGLTSSDLANKRDRAPRERTGKSVKNGHVHPNQ